MVSFTDETEGERTVLKRRSLERLYQRAEAAYRNADADAQRIVYDALAGQVEAWKLVKRTELLRLLRHYLTPETMSVELWRCVFKADSPR